MQLTNSILFWALLISLAAWERPLLAQIQTALSKTNESAAIPQTALGTAAILDEPGMPIDGMASSPAVIAAILRHAGLATELLSAVQLADSTRFNTSRFDLAILPTGQSFPARARESFIDFLRRGGGFISMGGYALDHLWLKVDGKWAGESEEVRKQIERAMRPEACLLPDGGFERSQSVPIGGSSPDGQWHRAGERCCVVSDQSREGRFCARVSIPADAGYPGDAFWAELPAQPGRTYQIRVRMRTEDVTGPGMAYAAVYEYDANNHLVEFRDFATARQTAGWQMFTYSFSPPPSVRRLRIPLGLYQAQGTAWFDDVRLGDVTGMRSQPMNTATGRPDDALVVEPSQIGVFDPSFPLKRARTLQTASGQCVLSAQVIQRGNFEGWAASGVIGNDAARWIPLLDTRDRYGRPRGAAAALVLNYHGFYNGSAWACFGIDNLDLFADPQSPMAPVLEQVAQFMVRKVFLRNLTTNYRLYRENEPVVVSAIIDDRGRLPFRGQVRFLLNGIPASGQSQNAVRDVNLEPGASQRVEATLAQPSSHADLCRVEAVLAVGGVPMDRIESGFVREDTAVLHLGPELRFVNNYF
ncbi:MAG: hypothetical protein M1608_18045, partial [Candidatus Omnitrophica bacterium]|nr:hypothetical protein [Candidatus Omnitrophota bacterium]